MKGPQLAALEFRSHSERARATAPLVRLCPEGWPTTSPRRKPNPERRQAARIGFVPVTIALLARTTLQWRMVCWPHSTLPPKTQTEKEDCRQRTPREAGRTNA